MDTHFRSTPHGVQIAYNNQDWLRWSTNHWHESFWEQVGHCDNHVKILWCLFLGWFDEHFFNFYINLFRAFTLQAVKETWRDIITSFRNCNKEKSKGFKNINFISTKIYHYNTYFKSDTIVLKGYRILSWCLSIPILANASCEQNAVLDSCHLHCGVQSMSGIWMMN